MKTPEFRARKEANPHGVVVVRHGKLAFEHYFRGNARRAGRALGYTAQQIMSDEKGLGPDRSELGEEPRRRDL